MTTESGPHTEAGRAEVVEVSLPPDVHAPAEARQVVREALLRWRLPGLVDAVVLVVSELVTNAVRYGRPPLQLVVRRNDDRVRLDVHDSEPREPAPALPAAAADDETGRGMAITGELASEVGVVQVPGNGKVVYAAFPTPPE